jgi:hypothetical protein
VPAGYRSAGVLVSLIRKRTDYLLGASQSFVPAAFVADPGVPVAMGGACRDQLSAELAADAFVRSMWL